jgi:hypothetical protein
MSIKGKKEKERRICRDPANKLIGKNFFKLTLVRSILGGARDLQSAAFGCFSFLLSLKSESPRSVSPPFNKVNAAPDTPRTVATVQDLGRDFVVFAGSSLHFDSAMVADDSPVFFSASLQRAVQSALLCRCGCSSALSNNHDNYT